MDGQFEDRLATVERALTDGETDLEAVTEGAATAEQVADLEDRLDTLENEVADIDAATQALRGYVGEVRSVNEAVEETAATAMAKAEEARSAAESRSVPPRTGAREDEFTPRSGGGHQATQDRAGGPAHAGSRELEETSARQDDERHVAGTANSSPAGDGGDGPDPARHRESGVATATSRAAGEPTRDEGTHSRAGTEPCPTCGRDGSEVPDSTEVGDTPDSGGARPTPAASGGSATPTGQPAADARVPEPSHRVDPGGTDDRTPARGRPVAGRESEDGGLLSRLRERL